MKVFVIWEEIEVDYEGSRCEIISVHASYEGALERVRKDIPDAVSGLERFDHPAPHGDRHYYMILEEIVLP